VIRSKTTSALVLMGFALVLCLPASAEDGDEDDNDSFLSDLPVEVHGFYEIRSGYRLREDKYQKDMSIMETRLQLDVSSYLDWADLKFKGDVLGDMVTERADFDLREAYMFSRPLEFMDLKVGRQILTWGTGDLVFINDLFPKDWQSFFIGRDTEYLKAPSDAAKISLFSDRANLDVVYTPQFDPDRFIAGERLSYWNSNLGRLAGRDAIVRTDRPKRWFRDSEFAARLYKNIKNYEFALYGYRGYWKSPGGQNASGQSIFPDLNVYGASVRGAIGKGIGSLEFKANLSSGSARDEYRHLTTLRLTKLSMNQNLRYSLFTYYSPTDKDIHLRPNVNYKVSDNLAIEIGANIFFGDHPNTFFGQFQDNTNFYVGLRHSF